MAHLKVIRVGKQKEKKWMTRCVTMYCVHWVVYIYVVPTNITHVTLRPVHTCEPKFANSSHQTHSKLIFRKLETNTEHPAPPSAPNSLCVHAKTRQISVCGKRYANHLQTVGRCSQSDTGIRAFGSHVYAGLQKAFINRPCPHFAPIQKQYLI